jgi:acriflavin resistance protein B
MAITVIFGLAFSTILTLVLIPILYSVVDSFTTKMAAKLKEVFGGLKKKGAK